MLDDVMREHISRYDTKQSKWSKDATKCPNEGQKVNQGGMIHSEHGNLGVSGSGTSLVCCRCGYEAPLGQP